MRHGPLATDARVILPTHNYTHQQYLFYMGNSQLQIQISHVCLLFDTTPPADLSAHSSHEPNFLSKNTPYYMHFCVFSFAFFCLPVLTLLNNTVTSPLIFSF